jgi:F-type H+-transporting ATPase subunit epsilon
MADTFQLRIVTPRAQLLDEPVLEVTAPGTAGEFGVLPNHITFLTSLEPGIITVKAPSGTRRLAVRSGFAEVADNVMTVLADAAEPVEDIDRARAEADLRAAQLRLEDLALSPTTPEYAAAQIDLGWAQARIDGSKIH